MKKFYPLLLTVLIFCTVVQDVLAQECTSLGATFTPYESRCAATGSIKVDAFGGSGNYKYKVLGTVSTNFTSADSITGLPAGTYTLFVTDISTNCSKSYRGIVVPGSYQDPRFTLNSVNVTCDNGNNGSISLNTLSFGRGPFTFAIIAPSPTGIGTTNNTGTFNNLVAGIYTIRLQDSCGGLQTRLVTINNYTWRLDAYPFSKISCDSASGYIRVVDSRGNVSTSGGIPGFTYGIIRAAGDTIWSSDATFTFALGGGSSFEVVAKDACGKMKKAPLNVNFRPSVGNSVNVYAQTCNSFSASLTSIRNFFGARFCIADSAGTELDCNDTGVFQNLPYGNYCISAYDSCSDTTIIRCFDAVPPPIRVDQFALISDKACATFTASITGQVGLTLPTYCLLDTSGMVLGCNDTGVFTGLPYGDYCITIRDSCRDTTITRCFNARKPGPVLPDIILPSYRNCFNFGLNVQGDSLFYPRFCLLDSSGAIVSCNNTGVFDSIAYGNYCISMYDSCYDTTITRCLGVYGPEVVNTITGTVSSRACKTFSINVYGSNIVNPYYCLYNSADSLIECDSTGAFDNVPYGTYYVKTHVSCPDTVLLYNFAEYPLIPSLNGNLNIGGRTCDSFTVSTSGEQNITNAQYCLYDSSNQQIACNATGVFTGLPYGSYCMNIIDGCYDTTITRCFSAAPIPVALSVTARKSCSNGFAKLSISVAGGVLPAAVTIYSPNGDFYSGSTYSNSTIVVDNMPGTDSTGPYKIVVTDQCGMKDSVEVMAPANSFSHRAAVIQRCPSSTWTNGSGTVTATASSNTGTVSYRIIKKDNTSYSPTLAPSIVSSGIASFNNLGPGRYIVRYRINDGCGIVYYDTVTVLPYTYPNLDRSTAYQCDQNGFSIGAVVSNGVGPFTYEIIGSSPAAPSIVSAPQASPVFSINNGTTYSLVRLRALDACGNATLEDASILPLANNGISADFNCFQMFSNLSIDTLYNSTYSWYRKHTETDADSLFLGSASNYYIPQLLPEDTGLYVCHLVVNGGCIRRSYYYRLTGACSNYLPVSLENFRGRYLGNDILLNWKLGSTDVVSQMVIERSASGNSYRTIGRMYPISGIAGGEYQFKDVNPPPGKNYYRLRLAGASGGVKYSNQLQFERNNMSGSIYLYPNPVDDHLSVAFKQPAGKSYHIQLLNLVNQVVKEIIYSGDNGPVYTFRRAKEMPAGIYVLKVTDLGSLETVAQKVIFQPKY